MKLISFDLEIAKEVTGDDWKSFRPLGISCAAVKFAQGIGQMLFYQWEKENEATLPSVSQEYASHIVDELENFVAHDGVIVTVNGLGFDFDVLAEESGRLEDCAKLAMDHHVDLMLIPLCHHGWPVGLQAFAEGTRIQGKLKQVTLKDGSIHEDMSGAAAPELWARGEYQAVLDYLKDDVRSTLQVAQVSLETGFLRWVSRKGKLWEMMLPIDDEGNHYLPTVRECLGWPVPDTSWMDNPIRREDLVAWMK